jgi:hypothetical protein
MKLTPKQRAGWQRIAKLLEELAEPTPSELLFKELRRFTFARLANELDRRLSLRKAERWVRQYIRPGKTRVSCYGLKHTLDHWYQARGSACYLRERDFTDALRRCGHVVKDGVVRIQELPD